MKWILNLLILAVAILATPIQFFGQSILGQQKNKENILLTHSDTLTKAAQNPGYSGNSGTKTVLIEEFNGAWCKYCPDGDVVLEEIAQEHPEDVVMVSVHTLDDMEIAEALGFSDVFWVSSFPSALIDRTLFPGENFEPVLREDWHTHVNSQLNTPTPVDVSITHTYNPDTRILEMTVQADFVEEANGDLRFIAMITEDSVTGTGSGYDQKNFYNTVVGHPYYGAGDPIVGYVHNRVLRKFLSGPFGNDGVISSPVAAATQITESFNLVLPANINEIHTNLIGLVAYYSSMTGQKTVLDVAKVKLTDGITKIEDISTRVGELKLFPNPASDQILMSFELKENIKARIAVFDIYGRQVLDLGNQDFPKGIQNLNIDISSLSEGIYQISLITPKHEIHTRKCMVYKPR